MQSSDGANERSHMKNAIQLHFPPVKVAALPFLEGGGRGPRPTILKDEPDVAGLEG